MTDPQQDRLDEVEEHIDDVRRTAEDHGTLPKQEQTLADPDGDGTDDPFRVQPPG